jgi:hypothetical protein
VSLLQPEPMSTSSSSPWPLSSRIARHFRPSAVRVNVTPVPPATTVCPPSSSSVTPAPPALWADGVADPPLWRMAVESSELVDSDPPTDVAGADVSGAVAVAGVGLALDAEVLVGAAVDVWVTEVLGVDGVLVLVTLDFTVATGAGAGAVVEVTDIRTDSGAFEPPLPTEGTVVLGDAATVVLVAGAAVVGGVAGATVVTGTLLAVVPWGWVPAGCEAGAVWAEAGRAFRTRKSPARSAKAATHLRGRTSSFPVLLLIRLNSPSLLVGALVGPRDAGPGGHRRDEGSKPRRRTPEQARNGL